MSSPAAQIRIAAVVLHDGGGFTSAALEEQTRQPDQIIELSSPNYSGVQDLSRSLRSGLITDRQHARRTLSPPGPGGAQNTQLWRNLERQLGEGFTPRYQWLWILPAGTVPAPDALERLEERLFTVQDEQTHSQIGIIGAKELHEPIGQEARLVSAGLWQTRSGEVLTRTEPMELDQGQYNGRDDVPAVPAHGMLIRASVLGSLGGFNPELSDHYAAAEFCARARETGTHIVLEPTARVYRTDPPKRDVLHRLGGTLWLPAAQRRSQIRARLSEASPAAVPFLWLGMWFSALLRLFAVVVCKAPGLAAGQFLTAAAALLNLGSIWHIRRFRKIGYRAALSRKNTPGRQEAADEKPLPQAEELTPTQLRAQRRRDITAETVGEHAQDKPGGHGTAPVSRRREDKLGLLLVVAFLAGVSLFGFRELLTSPALSGGAALPAGGLFEVWQQSLSFLVSDSLGERAAADPFNLVLLILSVLSLGHASAVLLWVMILAAPLSALTAWWAAGLWSPRTFHRVIAAAIWALLPGLHTAVGQGRIGPVLAHILLPLAVLATVKAVRARRGLSVGREAAAAAALLLAAVTAAAPILLVPVVLGCVIAALLLGRSGRVLWLLPIPALVVFGPMVISTVDRGGNLLAALLSEPGRLLPTSEAGAPAAIWQQLLGFSHYFTPREGLPGTGGDGNLAWLPPELGDDFWSLRMALLLGAPLLVIALLALLAVGRRGLVLTAGLTSCGLLGYSALAARATTGDVAGELVPANIGPVVSALALCLIAAGLSALHTSPAAESSLGGIFAPVATTLLILAIFASAVLWAAPRLLPNSTLDEKTVTAVNSQEVLIQPGQTRSLPATAADQGTGPANLRTLVLNSTPGGGLTAEIVSGSGKTLDKVRTAAEVDDLPLLATDIPGLTDPEQPPQPASELDRTQERLAELLAALVIPGSDEVSPLMAELGIGYVLVEQGTALSRAADTSEGLVPVGETGFGNLWRLDPAPAEGLATAGGISGTGTAWARIVTAEGEPVALLPSQNNQLNLDLSEVTTADGSTLTLEEVQDYYVEIAAERAAGWHAELDGDRLRPVTPHSLDVDPEELGWIRQFHLPAEATSGELQGQLSISHNSQFQYPILIGVAGVLLIFLLVALPLPRSWRLQQVTAGEVKA